MAGEHLRALIRDRHGDKTIEQIAVEARIDSQKIRYYLRRDTAERAMPDAEQVWRIAEWLDCDPNETYQALSRDKGYPMEAVDPNESGIDHSETIRLLRVYTSLPNSLRIRFVTLLDEVRLDPTVIELLLLMLDIPRRGRRQVVQFAAGKVPKSK